MSEVNLCDPEEAGADRHDGPSTDPVEPSVSGASRPVLQGLVPPGRLSTSSDFSPSPSAEANGLLSLPWEMVTHIASHLPAECVITVLPKVCRALGNVGKDNTAWQLRARRLIGPRASFPVGPRENFDWPAACLEMEQMMARWSGQVHLVPRQSRGDDQVERERAGQPVNEGAAAVEVQGEGRADEAEGAGVMELVHELVYGADEGMDVAVEVEDGEQQQQQPVGGQMQPVAGEMLPVDGEMQQRGEMQQPVVGADQLVGLGEELEERLEDELMEEERNHRMVFDINDGALDRQDNAVNRREDRRNIGRERPEQIEPHKPARSPSPPPALECIALPSGHIAQVNSVLLIGGEGKVCATGSRDWNVKLWDINEGCGRLLHTLGGQGDFSTHRGWVWSLASRGPLLASGGFDSTVRLWDLEAGGAERGLIRTGAAVLCLSCQTDVLLAGTFDKRVSIYDTRAAQPLVKSIRIHGNAVMCLAVDDKYIISGSKDCTVVVYDRRAGKGLKRIRLGSYLLSMSYSGNEVWAGDNNGMLHSFSMREGTLRTLSEFDVGHTALITGVHKSPGSLYTCSTDSTVKVHIPCAPPRTLCTLHHRSSVNGMSVDAGVFVVASGDDCVDIWRPRK